jgi:DtxR family transcriptional regulator, Mn-dependent transcriptional regulator
MESERTGEYLEAIYKQQQKKSPVSTSALADDLKVSLPAVTDMLRHLKEQELIDYRPNRGTTLTQEGEKKALGLIRRHRLWERFLTDVLGMKWDKVHDEACKLEHIESPELEKGLANILGDVNTCPHGQPIPDEAGRIKEEKASPLSRARLNQQVSVASIDREDPQLLKSIEKLGLKPGTGLKIVERAAGGNLKAEMSGRYVDLNKDMAEVIMTHAASKKTDLGQLPKMPLTDLQTGQTGIVNAYGGKKGMLGRCLSLGFTPGSQIKMMENYHKGPVLVKVHDTAVAVGRGLAEKIMVVRTGDPC